MLGPLASIPRPSVVSALALAVFTLAVFTPAVAGAQQPSRDPAGAEKLYDDATALLAKSDWDAACPMFEQSHKLDPSPGALLNLAGCAEHAGRVATAWSLLKDARSLNSDTASTKRRDEIERFVAAGLARLEPRIPTLAIRVASPPAAVRVLRDARDVSASLDKALPVDPGEHVIEVTAPGYASVRRSLSVAEGTHPTLEIVLERSTAQPEPSGEPPTSGPVAPASHEGPALATPTADRSGLGGVAIAGLVLGGTGVASIAASIATGALASGKKSELDALGCSEKPGANGATVLCAPEDVATAEALSSSGATLATVSTITTFAGVGLAGAGVVLFIVGISDDGGAATAQARLLPVVAPGFVGLSLSGTL